MQLFVFSKSFKSCIKYFSAERRVNRKLVILSHFFFLLPFLSTIFLSFYRFIEITLIFYYNHHFFLNDTCIYVSIKSLKSTMYSIKNLKRN